GAARVARTAGGDPLARPGTIRAVHARGGATGDGPHAPDSCPPGLPRAPRGRRRRVRRAPADRAGRAGRPGAARRGAGVRASRYPAEGGILLATARANRPAAVSPATR